MSLEPIGDLIASCGQAWRRPQPLKNMSSAVGTVFVVVADFFAFVVLDLRARPIGRQLDERGEQKM